MKRDLPKRIFLVGFIGAGKTTIGINLSKKINYKFIDTDREVEKLDGLPLKEILQKKGEEHFRSLEYNLLKNLDREENIIVSTSAGAGASKEIMDFLKRIGFVIFLNTPWDIIVKRIEEKRDILPSQMKIEDLYPIYFLRFQFYKKAHLVINFNEKETLEEFINRVERNIVEYFYEVSYNF